MERKKLVQALKELLTDEFDAVDFVDKSDEDLIYAIIDAGLYYQRKYNNL